MRIVPFHTLWLLLCFVPMASSQDDDEEARKERVIPVNDISQDIIDKASVSGKYSDLIYTLKVPEDKESYGEFYDWGYWGGGSWAGVKDNPAGYWVFVDPHWLVFKNKKADGSDRVIPVSDISDEIKEKSAVNGKYTDLIYVLKVPEDKDKYGDLKEYGYWGGGSWAGVKDNPAGYWVYVEPYWLVYKNSSEAEKDKKERVIPVEEISSDIVDKGTVEGKYSELIYVLNVQEDSKTYGEFKDYGHWGGGSWAGVKDNPAGYWVYVEPYWLVFKNKKD